MKIQEFKLERTMSLYQHEVEYDLTESGVSSLFPREFVDRDEWNNMYDFLQLRYVHTAGTQTLKEMIGTYYDNAAPANIFVTNGSAEAQFALSVAMFEPMDEIVYITPNYMLISGLAETFGAHVKHVPLREENNWCLDIDDLKASVTDKTKMLCVCNPNNPTGTILSDDSMKEIVEIARACNAWLLADEIYRGAEHRGKLTKSFWGMYEKVIVTCSLSKSFALPGLRLGWIVAPEYIVQKVWPYHDYMTISAGTINDKLATIALEPQVREKIFTRNRALARANLQIINEWVNKHKGLLDFIPPDAGSFIFLKYNLNMKSRDLMDRLMKEVSVFVVPGDCFGIENHLRVSFGAEEQYLKEALDRISEVITKLN